MSANYTLIVTCAGGLERHLADEIQQILPAASVTQSLGQVSLEGGLEDIYRICLWSRVASRVLLQLASARVNDVEELYDVAASIPWLAHLGPEHSFAVDFRGMNKWLRHTNFGGLKIKDAIVDVIRNTTGERPNVDTEDPAIRVYGHLQRDKFSLGIDMSGGGLHRRGYRAGGGLAPLRETLAAALLYQCGWTEIAAEGGSFLDPMCGSGTFVVEAAMMATDMAPGLNRESFGFEQWYRHSDSVWESVYREAVTRDQLGRAAFEGHVIGLDLSHKALQAAQRAVAGASLGRFVKIHKHDINDEIDPAWSANLVLTNPPYGERIGEETELAGLYQQLGNQVAALANVTTFGVFTSRVDLCQHMPLRSPKRNTYQNGDIEAFLLRFDMTSENSRGYGKPLPTAIYERDRLTEEGLMLYNRLKKNQKQLKAWIKRESISCYRVYDADLPEFSVAVDVYGDQLHIQEYAAPATIPEAKAAARFKVALTAISAAFNVPLAELNSKERRRQKGTSQYESAPESKRFFVDEFGHSIEVELASYLDTGLFLDHRPLRKRIMNEAKSKRFLNLFCYTAVASLHAAMAGAKTTSVDMSRTYLNWAKDSFRRNYVTLSQHEFEQANCVEWLANATGEFDIIMLDPPTFSNSKRMTDVFDVQKDHETLIDDAMRLLAKDGTLYFSNNYRKFKLEPGLLERYEIENISASTIDVDFKRNPKIHQCWIIRHG
jgi:23S rRNA (guanine2445-N2)-methyltransferase / 23S rRNA (guanine2069-N7)-methyltransferase